MKHNFYRLITSYALITTLSCSSMENTKKEIITEIAAIQRPRFAQYLTEDRVVITGENGCSIVNPMTNKEIKKISTIGCFHLSINPHKTKIALSQDNATVTIYDILTGTNEWSKTKKGRISYAAFSPYDESIFILYTNRLNKLKKYNYLTNERNGRYINDDLYSFFTLSRPRLTSSNERFEQITFYNQNSILATLSQNYKKSWIEYWNLKTQTLIHKHSLPSKINNGLAFSPDKTKVLITLSDKCIILPVPDEVIKEHNNIIKEKMLFPSWILKNYQLKNPQMQVPDDIMRYIVATLRQTYDA